MSEHKRREPCCVDEALRYLSVQGHESQAEKLAKAGAAFLAAAQLERMTKAPDYIAKKRRFRTALRAFEEMKER